MSDEPKLVRDANNAALAAVALLIATRRALGEEHNEPDYADAHPEVLAMCMSAAAQLHVAGVLELAHGLIERHK